MVARTELAGRRGLHAVMVKVEEVIMTMMVG